MPTAHFTDLPSQFNAIKNLTALRNDLLANGMVFDKSVTRETFSVMLQDAITSLRRLRLIEDIYAFDTGVKVHITCDTCDDKHTCRSAFDMYNLDGDCLEEK